MYCLQALGHDELGAALIGVVDVKFIHEGAHQENAASGALQQVFVCQRVRDVFEAEAYSLVAHVNYEFFGSQLKGDEDFFSALFLASVIVGVDHAFANGHADFEAVVIVEADGARNRRAHFFGETDAIEQRFESDLNPLRPSAGAIVGVVRQGGRMYNTPLCEVNVASHWMSQCRVWRPPDGGAAGNRRAAGSPD